MKRIIKIAVLLLILLLPFIGTAQKRTHRANKKIEKNIAKIWKDLAIEEMPLTTDIAIEFDLFFEENQLSQLMNNENLLGYLLLRKGYGCQIGGCGAGNYGNNAVCSLDGAIYETFDYVLLFDKDLTVLKVIVVDYPGDYGYEINSKNWLKQFIGYQGEELNYGSDIDAISGATISANSITTDIQKVHSMLKKLLEYKKNSILTGAASH